MSVSSGGASTVIGQWGGAAAVLGVLVIATPRIGEPDKSDSRAIAAIRAIVSAESAYAAARGGRFATIECLNEPACGSPNGGVASLLSRDVATTLNYDGYRIEFYPHPDPESDRRARAALERFAVAAVPASPARAAKRAFCADDRGVVYVTAAGRIPLVEQGRCADTHTSLRASR